MGRAKGQSGLKFPGFGERVAARAQALGYPNLSAFARDKKIDKSSVYAWADDRVPGADNLTRLANDLDVEWQWLLVGDWSAGAAAHSSQLPTASLDPAPPEADMSPEDRHAWELWYEFSKDRKGKRAKEWGLVSRFVVFVADLHAGQPRQSDEKKPAAPKRRLAQ